MKRAVLAVLALLLFGGTALAAEDLDFLVQEYEVAVRRRDPRGFARQEAILARIADLQTPGARAALLRLRDRRAQGHGRQMALILGALTRHAGPDDLDSTIRWVEGRRDALLLELLGPALAEIRSPTAWAALRGDLLRRATPPVKAQIVRALGLLKDREAVSALVHVLGDADIRVRTEALVALGLIGDRRAASLLIVFLKDADWRVRDATARALGHLGGPAAPPALCKALDDPSGHVVESAADALARLDSPCCIGRLIERLEALSPTDLRVADVLARALESITGKAFGLDTEGWKRWWAVVKDRPLVKDEMAPSERTVPGHTWYGFRIRSSKVAFVLDVSRSMGWSERLPTAQRELIAVLEALPRSTRFNVIAYSDTAIPWKEVIEEATPSAVRRAVRFTRRQKPISGTNTYDALRTAFA
ncbi:MAG: HEAT repeat domain-containing protein, partial [Planctomycetota bacterium]